MNSIETVGIWVARCIWLQTAVIGALSLQTLIFLWTRRRGEKSRAELQERYGTAIVFHLIQETETTAGLPQPKTPFERKCFQASLISHMRSVSGPDRLRLEGLYREMGFEMSDFAKCRSWSWGTRIQAIANLSGIRSSASAQILLEMRHDPNDLVATSALLALSSLDHPLSHPDRWGHLPKSLLKRRSVLLKILDNVAKNHGLEILIGWTRERGPWSESCLQVLLSQRSPQTVPTLCEFLSAPELPVQWRREILQTLGAIGDPTCLSAAEFAMKHGDESVRTEAAGVLRKMGLLVEAA